MYNYVKIFISSNKVKLLIYLLLANNFILKCLDVNIKQSCGHTSRGKFFLVSPDLKFTF